MNKLKDKHVIVMGGGTAGWISALYLLNWSKKINLDLKVSLVSSDDVEIIGVGEGTTPGFSQFIHEICNISKEEFLQETKGSFKYGVKFLNWNFDNEYYYNLVFHGDIFNSDDEIKYDFIQHAINNDLNIPQKDLQKKFLGTIFDLLENNKILHQMFPSYAYHFSANLLIQFLRKKCCQFHNFSHVIGNIKKINYDKNGYIKSLNLEETQYLDGDFFINCLGFNSANILEKEYFKIVNWDNYILNNSAFAIQVKNSVNERIEPYTTSTAKEYGWCWKIPQYEKTGYGYVYSDKFITDEDKLYNDLLKTYNINERDIFKTKLVKSVPYYNCKQLHKNCLSIGLSSGFVEPLEATSINMSLVGLNMFFELIESGKELNQKYIDIFNNKMESNWNNVFKFIIFHYFTNNPINDYWKHYKNIQENKLFDFYEKYTTNSMMFSKHNYFSVSLGMKMKDFYYNFFHENYISDHFDSYFSIENNIDLKKIYGHNEVLDSINKKLKNNFSYV